MRKLRLILIAILVFVLGGCSIGPTSVPTPTPTVSPTSKVTPGVTYFPPATSALTPPMTPLPTEATVLTLPSALMNSIGIGTLAPDMLSMAGLPAPNDNLKCPTVFQLSGGGEVRFTYAENINFHSDVVAGIAVNGTTKIAPVPDPTPILDFQLVNNGFTLKPGGFLSISALKAAFETPLTDTTVKRVVVYDETYIRTMTYTGLTLELYQAPTSLDKDQWWLTSVVITGSSYATPRGLKVGMEAKEAVNLFGTGAFILDEQGTQDELQKMTVFKMDDVNDVSEWRLLITFVDNKISSITIFINQGDV